MREPIAYSLTELGRSIVEENTRLAYKIGLKYKPPYGMTREEWNSECLDCLCLAVAFHDSKKGTLSTICDRLIRLRRQNINDYNSRLMRSRNKTLSLDAERCGETGARFEFMLGFDSDQFREVDVKDLTKHITRKLKGTGKQIVELFADGLTLKEIGKKLGFSRQHAHNMLLLQREKLVIEFPEMLVGAPSCGICGSPVVMGTTMNKPKYCPKCSRVRRERSHKESQNRRREGISNAR